MELANKGSSSRMSLFSLWKKNELSNVILMRRQATLSMGVTKMQHSSLDSPEVHRQTDNTGHASQQTEGYI